MTFVKIANAKSSNASPHVRVWFGVSDHSIVRCKIAFTQLTTINV